MNGAVPALRSAGRGDLPGLQRFVGRLSLRSRVQRFFSPLRELPSPLVRAIERGDGAHRLLLAEHAGEVVALGQYAVVEGGRCELALVVADDWQGRGIGRALIDRLLADAALRGLHEAVLETMVDNRAMKSLAQRAGFVLRPHPEDRGLAFGRRSLTGAKLPFH